MCAGVLLRGPDISYPPCGGFGKPPAQNRFLLDYALHFSAECVKVFHKVRVATVDVVDIADLGHAVGTQGREHKASTARMSELHTVVEESCSLPLITT